MAKPPFRVEAGFLPYSDGSGHEVAVALEQEYDGGEVLLSINTAWRFDVAKWPEIRDGIERLLKGAPAPAPIPQQQNTTQEKT